MSAAEPDQSGALRYDEGKPPLHLVPASLVLEVARVFDAGARKYSAHNWRKGMAWSRAFNSLQRHLLAWADGQDSDPETGLPHLAHAGCNLAFLIEYAATHPELDDRYRAPAEDAR